MRKGKVSEPCESLEKKQVVWNNKEEIMKDHFNLYSVPTLCLRICFTFFYISIYYHVCVCVCVCMHVCLCVSVCVHDAYVCVGSIRWDRCVGGIFNMDKSRSWLSPFTLI